ncbi:hypothetical protein BKA70DRAFT_1202019, partial [Coprinopsis sp. MPI-PUGE-AT-0042]
MTIAPERPSLARPPSYTGPTPLPPNQWDPCSRNPEEVVLFSAYDVCLSMETGASGLLDLIYARILGYLLLHVVLDSGRVCIGKEILQCQGYLPKLHFLAQGYQQHLLQAVRPYGSEGSGSSSSNCASSEADLDDDFVTIPVQEPSASYLATKDAALRRDSFKCLITGFHDSDYVAYCILNGLPMPEGQSVPTEATHIFPPYLGQSHCQDKALKSEWSGTVWSQLKHFGVEREELAGDKVHHLGNIMTLAIDMHIKFQRLKLWFEADPYHADNRHFVTHAQMAAHLPENRQVISTDPNPDAEYVSPNPKFLRAHGAICRIAHLSGAARFMDRYERINDFDESNTRVLASDGSSADWLQMRLRAMLISHHIPIGG